MPDKYWVGSTGNWSDTTHWSTSSGGAGSAGVPVAGEVVTIDNHASGLNGGTLTINTAVTCGSIAWQTAVGTITNSGNFNITLDGNGGFVGSGTTARTWIGGTGFIKMTAGFASFNVAATTGLTNPATAFSGNTVIFQSAAPSVGNNSLNLPGAIVLGGLQISHTAKGGVVAPIGSNVNVGAVLLSAGNHLMINNDIIMTSLTGTGTASNPIGLVSNGAVAWISIASGTHTIDWAVMRGIHFNPTAGATLTVTNAVHLGGCDGTGLSMVAPTGGGGGGSTVGVIGG